MGENETLFDEEFMKKIAGLKVMIRKKSLLPGQGRRKSSQKGISAEFADFREYLPGDDIRKIDWNVYARLDKPYIRRYTEERESAVNIFLDLSGSMGFWGKDVLAKRLAGAISVVTLAGQDRVALHIIAGEKVTSLRLRNSSQGIQRVLSLLTQTETGGRSDLHGAISHMPHMLPGLCVIISDFMEESFLQQGDLLCRQLALRGQEVVLLQVLAKEELSVEETGTYEMVDAEGAEEPVLISLDERTVQGYDRELKAFLKEVENTAKKNNAACYRCSTDEGIDEILLGKMRGIWV